MRNEPGLIGLNFKLRLVSIVRFPASRFCSRSYTEQLHLKTIFFHPPFSSKHAISDPVNSTGIFLRGCLHEKTRTGASFIPT